MGLFGRIEDKHGVDEPGYEPPPAASDEPTAAPEPKMPQAPVAPWRWMLRGMLFLVVLVSSPAFVLRENETVWDMSAGRWVGGVVAALITMAILGGIVGLVRRVRDTPRNWALTTFTVPVMLVTLLLGAATQVGRQQTETNEATANAAGKAGTSTAAIREAQDQFVRWMDAYFAGVPQLAKTGRVAKHLEVIEKERPINLEKLQQAFDEGYAASRSWSASIHALPTENPKLAAVGVRMAHGASVETDGWRDYSQGLRAKDIKRVEHGDAVRNRGRGIIKQAVMDADAYYGELGGAKAFGNRSDFHHLEKLLIELRSVQ